jgi:hypothetical protein
MEEILSKKHYRRSFYIIFALSIIVLALIRIKVLPSIDESISKDIVDFLSATIETLIVSFFITVSLGTFIFWLTPEIVKKSEIEVIDPKEINPLLKKAITDTKTWIVKGACGRFTRAATIPNLAEAAKHEGIGRDIRICLLDPNNEEVCEEYANYRRSLKSAEPNNPWTKYRVQHEVIATVLSALQYQYKEPLLTITVHLSNSFSAFRLDISDHYAIVTKEDKEASGLRADSGTYFYNSYKDDIRLTERQSREIIHKKPLNISDKTDPDNLKEIIKDTKIVSDQIIENLDMSKILEYINNPKEPYGKGQWKKNFLKT